MLINTLWGPSIPETVQNANIPNGIAGSDSWSGIMKCRKSEIVMAAIIKVKASAEIADDKGRYRAETIAVKTATTAQTASC